MEALAPKRLPRAWYSAPFSEFLAQSTKDVIGDLTLNSALNINTAQGDAGAATNLLLKQHLAGHKITCFWSSTSPAWAREPTPCCW
ncbi:MAG TPA: hypothetical protein VNQ32_06040 [Steroidobacteraceae bacterium]|nr:hypothetical protein [Steroidobacteraceae bacterium]